MSEEEKNAIDELKSRREYFEYQPEGCNWNLSFDQWEVHTVIDVIISLIDKQNKEINRLQEENKTLKEQIHYKEAESNNKDIFKHWEKK